MECEILQSYCIAATQPIILSEEVIKGISGSVGAPTCERCWMLPSRMVGLRPFADSHVDAAWWEHANS